MICLPVLVFSQNTDSLAIVAKETAAKVLKEKRAIDSIRKLKENEVNKQIALLKKLRQKLAHIQNQTVKQSLAANPALIEFKESKAIKTDSDTIYWEEVRRKWTGRLFNKSDTRYRLFRFENGRKVYLN